MVVKSFRQEVFYEKKKQTGLTLIELLVSMSIVSLLIALMIPAVQSARESARRVQCLNNMRQIGLAFQNHLATHRHLPKAVYTNQAGEPLHSWFVEILPYLEQTNLQAQYNRTMPFSHQSNALALATKIEVAVCPSRAGAKEETLPSGLIMQTHSYHPVIGVHPTLVQWFSAHGLIPYGEYQTAFGRDAVTGAYRAVGSQDFTNGMSNTWLLVESDGAPERWHDEHVHQLPYVPGGSAFDTKSAFILHGVDDNGMSPGPHWAITNGAGGSNDFDKEPFSFHPGIINVLRADGGVHSVSTTLDLPTVIKFLSIHQ